MKVIVALALAGLMPMVSQASPQGGSADTQGCQQHRKSGAYQCPGTQRIRIVLPASPPPVAAVGREEQTVSTIPGATSCHAGARGGYTINSDGRIIDPGC
jgi:hypothetical protein